MSQQFQRGDMVAMASSPATVGVVTEVQAGGAETRYTVWHDNREHRYYASQLIPVAAAPAESTLITLGIFKARLTALQLLHPGVSALYSLHAARIDFIPYQFKPVLKLIRADRPRLLIADEVGVGKTIEAGLILRELQTRREIRSALVLCPKSLVTDHKWERELKRFDESFTQLDGPMLRHCIRATDFDGEWPDRYSKAIVPFSLLDTELLLGDGYKRKGLLDLDPPPQFDLIICDEAHNIRNPETQAHQAVSFLCQHADAVVFLTATPIQLRNRDLFVLLNVLRPDLVRDVATFERMAEPNPHINRAINAARAARPDWQQEAQQSLIAARNSEWGRAVLAGNPDFEGAAAQLRQDMGSESRLAFIRTAEELHTFAPIINRTRRRDIGTFTTRAPETIAIPFTPAQQALHYSLLAAQERILSRYHDVSQIKFLMTTIRRQAASCLHGLAPFLRDILTRRDMGALSEDFEREESELNDVVGDIRAIQREIQAVLEQADQLDDHDPKCEALLDRVRQKQELDNNKLLIFSAFHHTLIYLVRHIENTGVRCGLIHGDVRDEDRLQLRHRFSLAKTDPGALDVLLSSEVGCEGLDYQFCDCLANYDIPWNPMRVEQRIGRIDRYGQKSQKVVIYNFITPGTVDADIYERCLDRIGVFRQSLGGSEEILGGIAQKIQSIAEDLQLTEDERKERLQQLADNEIRLQQEQQALEDKQIELFGLTLPPAQAKADIDAVSSPWLSPESLQNLVEIYLEAVAGKSQNILGAKTLKILRASQETRHKLLSDYERSEQRTGTVYRAWERWLKGGEPTLSITFDDSCASDHRNAAFITPVHPLALQAARALIDQVQACTVCRAHDAQAPNGAYPFAIYQWQKQGIRPDVSFIAVCEGPIAPESFMALLERAQPADSGSVPQPDQQVLTKLDQQHYARWARERESHQEETRRLVTYRYESLRTSHEARMAILRERLAHATDERIRRIPQGAINAAEADYARYKLEIERAEASADIIAKPVAFGIMIVENDDLDP